jgi:hypothetical protein
MLYESEWILMTGVFLLSKLSFQNLFSLSPDSSLCSVIDIRSNCNRNFCKAPPELDVLFVANAASKLRMHATPLYDSDYSSQLTLFKSQFHPFTS